VLIWTAMMLKKRIVVYGDDIVSLLKIIRTIPILVWHRQSWDQLRPFVGFSNLEIDDLKNSGWELDATLAKWNRSLVGGRAMTASDVRQVVGVFDRLDFSRDLEAYHLEDQLILLHTLGLVPHASPETLLKDCANRVLKETEWKVSEVQFRDGQAHMKVSDDDFDSFVKSGRAERFKEQFFHGLQSLAAECGQKLSQDPTLELVLPASDGKDSDKRMEFRRGSFWALVPVWALGSIGIILALGVVVAGYLFFTRVKCVKVKVKGGGGSSITVYITLAKATGGCVLL